MTGIGDMGFMRNALQSPRAFEKGLNDKKKYLFTFFTSGRWPTQCRVAKYKIEEGREKVNNNTRMFGPFLPF